MLPLFLCSIQLITIPLAAFTKGKIKEASLDFVLIFGILGAVFGTVGATQIYNANPVFSMDPIVSAITHSISGFASLYISAAPLADFPYTLSSAIHGIFLQPIFLFAYEKPIGRSPCPLLQRKGLG